ncbi:MAG TPA: amidohydrolase family protein [Jiangellaceae bacterium]
MAATRVLRRVGKVAIYALIAVVMLVAIGIVGYQTTSYRAAQPQQGHLALTGATVLAGDDLDVLENATVLIEDGVIVDVGVDVDVPADGTVIDVSGRTVLPGLMDLHVHLGTEHEAGQGFGPLQIPGVIWDSMRFNPDNRRSFLQAGVTTVRSLGNEHGWVTDLRGKLASGELEGPRLFAAGPVFTTRGGHPVVTIFGGRVVGETQVPDAPDEARDAVRRLATGDRAVDVIKVIQERGREGRRLEPIAPAVLQAIIDEAHEHGLAVTAHWGTEQDLAEALDAGVDGLEHIGRLPNGWPDEALDTIVSEHIPVAPTLAVTEVGAPDVAFQQMLARTAELHEAGGRIVVGSDAGMPGVPFGGGVHRELELLVESGLTPREALRAATSEAAAALGVTDIGVIEPGRAADILVVDGDPLAAIGDIRNVLLVFRDGRKVVDGREVGAG